MILHILLKDLRRQWREIALYILVCAEWAWQQAHTGSWIWQHQREMLPFMLFGLWVFIVVRAVHGECLVGDREFWATRPYRWWQLLIEKALLCFLALNVPLFIAQIYLLHHARLPITATVLFGLLILQLMIAGVATFPTAAIAAVTQTLVQWILTIAGIILFAIVLTWLPWDSLAPTLTGEENAAGSLGMAIVGGAMLFMLVWQYARRGVWPARAAFAVAILAVPAMILLARVPMLRAAAYPQVTSRGIHVSIRPDPDGTRSFTRRDPAVGEPSIRIPIIAVPEDPHTVMSVEGVRLAMHGDAGWTWDSGWTSKSFWLGAGSGESSLEFNMPAAVIDQMQQSHAQATIELAYVAYRLTREQKIDTSHRYFVIPDVGQCIWGEGRGIIFNSSGLNCVAPLRLPGILVARMQVGESTCSSGKNAGIPGDRFAAAVLFGNDDTPVYFDIDPVRNLQLNFGYWLPLVPTEKNGYRQAELCRGTPFTVQTGHAEGRMQSRFELGAVGKQVTPDTGGDGGSDD
jgi:hypothetical protein